MVGRNQHFPPLAVRDLHNNQSCHRKSQIFGGFGTGNHLLCETGLTADGKSGHFTVYYFITPTSALF